LRAVWRLTHPAPPLPVETPRAQKAAAAVAHVSLYVLLFFMPLSGYVGLAARGRTITVAGLFDLPNLVPQGLALARRAQSLHENAQYVLYALLAVHIGAALYHRFVLKDGVLARMWPGVGSSA
jgi:cytochrome b561